MGLNERRPSPERETASADTVRVDRPADEPRNVPTREGPTRRTVLGRGTKILVYTTPLVQLIFPSKAMAAYGAYS